MSEVIWCKTRYQDIGYHSYNDLWRLVELAGYRTIYVDQIDPASDNTYIVTPLNDEWLDGWQHPRARIIHLELEWRTDWRAEVDTPPGVSETWACDAGYAPKIGAKYVPLGSDDRLNELNVSIPAYRATRFTEYDVSLISYQTPRRQVITQQLKDKGLRLSPPEKMWSIERSTALLRSNLMLHVHQNDNTNTIAPLRWCLAAAHHLPIVSERVDSRGVFNSNIMLSADYEYLVDFTLAILKEPELLQRYAANLHHLLCVQWPFKRTIEEGLRGCDFAHY